MTKIRCFLFLFIIILSLTGCEIYDAAVERAVEQTQTQKELVVTKTKNPSPSLKNPTFTKKPISTVKPTSTVRSAQINISCTPASSVTINQKGKTLEVCGLITYASEEPCPQCPYGYYAYLVLDKNFYIISYDWVFSSEWIGDCIMVKDIVEPFGSKPAFVFGAREGYDGSKCEYSADGSLFCKEGNYFQAYSGCK